MVAALACASSVTGFAGGADIEKPATAPVSSPAPQANQNQALEKELALLKARLSDLESKLDACACSQKSATSIAAPAGKTGKVFSQFDVELYGYICANVSYDSHGTVDLLGSTNNGDLPYAVTAKNTNNNSHFSATARQTRLGLNVKGPEVLGGKVSATIETDFYGSASSQGSCTPRMRHAYAKWVKDSWTVLAGQTWDSFITVMPDTINFNTLAYNGQLGNRRAQVRVAKSFNPELKKGDKITLTGAIARPGYSATGYPHLQYNAAYDVKLLTEKPSTFSISGVVGKEKGDATGAYRRYKVWAVIGSINLPVTSYLSFKGSAYTGANLGGVTAYYGCAGSNYTINYTPDGSGNSSFDNKSVRSVGGWLQATVNPIKKLAWNTGYGIDAPKKNDILAGASATATTSTGITRIYTVYTNLIYSFTDNLSAGLEYQYLKTTRKVTDNSKADNRIGAMAMFKF